jgi:hypothetical protein
MNTYQHFNEDGYFTNRSLFNYHLVETDLVMNPPYRATFKDFDQPIPANKWPKFNQELDEWTLVDSFVGTEYWDVDGESFVIDKHEMAVPANMFLVNPGPSLNRLRPKLIRDIVKKCGEEIVAGFSSSALGTPHMYPSDTNSQLNLNGSITDSYDPTNSPEWVTMFSCVNSEGIWARRMHTSEQIRLVGKECKLLVTNCLLKKDRLVKLIELAETLEQAQQFTWSSE